MNEDLGQLMMLEDFEWNDLDATKVMPEKVMRKMMMTLALRSETEIKN